MNPAAPKPSFIWAVKCLAILCHPALFICTVHLRNTGCRQVRVPLPSYFCLRPRLHGAYNKNNKLYAQILNPCEEAQPKFRHIREDLALHKKTTFWDNKNRFESAWENIICQNWNLSQLEFVRIEICQNWNLSELEFVRIGICQNPFFAIYEEIGNCQNGTF